MTHLLRTFLLLWSTCSSAALQLQVLGHPNNNYTALVNTIQQFNQDIIVLQSRNPDASTIEDDHLLLMPGHSFDLNNKGNQHILVLAGELDGVFRFSNFASALHIHRQTPRVNFVVVQGAAHYSFATPTITAAKLALDLQPEITNAVAQQTVATVVKQWLNPQRHGNKDYTAARLRALQLATPIVKALQLEGSAHTGQDICNSDFPTNPTCNYPKYPVFSLPPGPAPAPSPLPSKECICGSKWVTEYAFPSFSGGDEKGFTVQVADAFHNVADVHPFHLPHNWNSCTAPKGCNLNVTTLTMNVNGSGTLFPNASDMPLSALELRTKMKSRQILWEAAGLGKQSGDIDKKNMTLCKNANQMAWDWAMSNADPAVRARFLKFGEPFVMVDDVAAPIGFHGPTWIEKELLYTRNPATHTIEVQSWTFVVGESPIKSKYLPTGMHYCKLLSPARCMEWLYTDGLRSKIGVQVPQVALDH